MVDHVQDDIVQKIVNVEQLTLFKNRGVPLQIHWVHDTSVVQSKELYKENHIQ